MLWLSWNSFIIPDNCGVSSVRVHTYFGRFFSRYDENLIPGSKTMITNTSDLVSAIESENTTTLNCCTYWQDDASSPVLCPLNSVRGYWRLLESNSLSMLASPFQIFRGLDSASWCLYVPPNYVQWTLVRLVLQLASWRNFVPLGTILVPPPPRISKSIHGFSITVLSYFARNVYTRRLG